MENLFDVSVTISTYNRCDILPRALESLLAQETGGVRYEVVIVDNNSTDQTRQVVESFIKRGDANLRYVFEAKQGLSHGRNAAIAVARAPIIAITDDDVQVTPNWVAAIKRAFDEHPEVDFIGGKVLCQPENALPSWLTREHWSPLALQDHGETPFYVNEERPICLVTANASFRRQVFDRIGLFSPEFPRSQDHELEMRLWRAGGQGMYVPGIVVTTEVQAERLTKTYHRQWHGRHGKVCALMPIEVFGPDRGLVKDLTEVVTLLGVPACFYRQLISESGRLVAATMQRREGMKLYHENRVRHLLNYISVRCGQNAAERKHSHFTEVRAFLRAMLRKKINEVFAKAGTIDTPKRGPALIR